MSFTASQIVWKSYSDFFKSHKQTFNNYQKYGEVVLQTDLETDLDGKKTEFIEIFTESSNLTEFEAKMKKYWVNHHRIILEKLSDIAKVYKIFGNTVDIRKADKRFDNDYLEPVIIFDELFEYIKTHVTSLWCSKYKTVLIKYDNHIYEIEINSGEYLHICKRHNVEDVILSVPE